MLPIVQRELQVAARNPKLYTWRFRAGLLIILLALGMILSSRGGLRSAPAGTLFQALSTMGLLFCLFEGIRKASDSITEEKRQGTLGLLFLTDLTGFDIVLGKLATATVRSFSFLLAFVPVLSVSLLLGGTTGGEFWRVVLTLLLTLSVSLCLCLFISAISRERSIIASLGVLLILCIAPNLIGLLIGGAKAGWISPASPFYLLFAASDASYLLNPSQYWRGVLYLVILSISAITLASIVLPKAWQDKPLKGQKQRRLAGKLSPKLAHFRNAMLDRNPVMWLVFNPRSHRNLRAAIWFIGIAAPLSFLIISFGLPKIGLPLPPQTALIIPGLAGMALALVASLHIALESSRNFAEARENGALELILSTPLKVREIIKGQWLALRMNILPASVLLCVFGAFAAILVSFYGEPTQIVLILKVVSEGVLGFVTIAWTGMWMGLTSRSPARAFFKAIVIGLILPHLICTPTLLNQIFLLVLAMDKVKVHFRKFAAERYLSPSHLVSALTVASDAPPVLRNEPSNRR